MNPAMPTLFLTKVSKTYDGENTASSTNVLGKVVINLQKTETVLVSTQNGSRTIISDSKL
jgi:hypothetical protein